MNAQEIIQFIASAEKKTPVKLYVKENAPVDFGSARVFGAGDKVVFGDWAELKPILERNADRIADLVIEDVPENAVVAGCPARVIKMKDAGTSQKTALEAALRTL